MSTSKLRFLDYAAGIGFAVTAVWIAVGFVRGDPFLHNGELVSGLFTRAIQLAIYLVVAALIVANPYVYWLIRTGRFTWKTIVFPLTAMLLGLLLVYPPVSYFYERSLMVRSRIHPFIQLFPESPPEDLSNRSEDQKLIVCMGGSTTLWGGDGRVWPPTVEENLRAADKNVRVLRQAQPWFTTMHTLYNYQTNVRKLRPDVVIVMHAINDLSMNADGSYFSSGKFRPDYGHNLGPFARISSTRPLPDLVVEVARRSWNYPPREEIDTDVFPGLETFRQNLRNVAKMAKDDGTQVIFMTQGSLYKEDMPQEEIDRLYLTSANSVGPDSYWAINTALRGMRQYNEATKEIAKEMGVHLVDLDKVLPKDLKHFNDDCHYRGPGVDVIAEQLTRELLTLLDG